jgi:signal transduction histidine kinase
VIFKTKEKKLKKPEMRLGKEIKPFQLVKYFAYSSFFLILFSFLTLSFIVFKSGRSLTLQKSEEYAWLVVKNLNHQIFLYFSLPVVAVFGQIRLREKAQFERLDKVVRNTIHGFDIKQVNIYDLDGIVTYSTNEELVGKKVNLPPEFQGAKEGNFASRLEQNKLKTYAPFRAQRGLAEETSIVLGIFEITQDLSKDYQIIRQFYIMVIGSSVFIMGLLFLGLTLIVRRAEKIIGARSEERRRLEDSLRQAEHLANLGEMVAAVSHEIKNPLGVISSTAELLHNRIKESPSDSQLTKIVLEEAKRLNQILTDFLEFARPEIPKFNACSVTELIDKILVFFLPECGEHGIEIIKKYQDKPVIEADSNLLYRAFLNIVINAIQAMPSGGKLEVLVEKTLNNNGLVITFADSGTGIPEEILNKVFTPFFTTMEKGSGLGLAIVKRIIENHNGRVKIESKIGEGTKLTIFLPY